MTWFFVNQGQQAGPISDIQLDEYILAGKILPETLLWRDGMPTWQPCQEVKAALALKAPVLKGLKSTGDTIINEIVCATCGGLQAREGAIRQGDAWICAACKPVHSPKGRAPVAAQAATQGRVYAGIGARAVAKIIDSFILGLPAALIMGAVVAFALPASIKVKSAGAFLLMFLGALFLVTVEFIAYQICFLPKYGATPGKKLMGLRVIKAGGGNISWGLAIARFAGECVSGLIPLFIGYLIAAFDPEKRTVHDHIAGTRVIKI
jgi:uncharacterized RDD family membrane protein YckC